MSRESLRRAFRTFVITTLALFIPGLLGWLNNLTEWARSEGQKPFPDGHGLAYLGVSAIVAGVVATINLAWNSLEDAIGKGVLRDVPARSNGQDGAAGLDLLIRVVAIAIAVFLVIWLLSVLLGT